MGPGRFRVRPAERIRVPRLRMVAASNGNVHQRCRVLVAGSVRSEPCQLSSDVLPRGNVRYRRCLPVGAQAGRTGQRRGRCTRRYRSCAEGRQLRLVVEGLFEDVGAGANRCGDQTRSCGILGADSTISRAPQRQARYWDSLEPPAGAPLGRSTSTRRSGCCGR